MKARLGLYFIKAAVKKEFLEVKIVSSLAHDLVSDMDSSSSEDVVLSELAVPARATRDQSQFGRLLFITM